MKTTVGQDADARCNLTANASLAEYTSFAVKASAARLAKVIDPSVMPDLLDGEDGQIFILGGGSNVLFTQDYPGLIIHVATRGIQLEAETEADAHVRVAAGEVWDSFVRWSLAQGFCGLENLILIPGSVGAAPIQNIGAYGVEVAEFIHAVEVWDRADRSWRTLGRDACAFAYRDSIFKREPGRYVVSEVVFELGRTRPLVLDYAGVRDELSAMEVNEPTPTDVGAAVERLRKRKLPDPAVLGNAGSFFKNPIIDSEIADDLRARHAEMPVYPLPDGRVKLSAAWLIERCGFKGARAGNVGVSEKHALVLVNHGGASGAEVWALAQTIRDTVAQRFGCTLEPEPSIL